MDLGISEFLARSKVKIIYICKKAQTTNNSARMEYIHPLCSITSYGFSLTANAIDSIFPFFMCAIEDSQELVNAEKDNCTMLFFVQ